MRKLLRIVTAILDSRGDQSLVLAGKRRQPKLSCLRLGAQRALVAKFVSPRLLSGGKRPKHCLALVEFKCTLVALFFRRLHLPDRRGQLKGFAGHHLHDLLLIVSMEILHCLHRTCQLGSSLLQSASVGVLWHLHRYRVHLIETRLHLVLRRYR